ncbi:MAG: transcription antitermination factor NusB [Actinobacteria bacterium]|jgi:N utilization substance protein B|nr:transcription antitermination factor NusB [Actinomycetota bacterium]
MSAEKGGSRRHDARTEAREQAVMLLYEAEQRSCSVSVLLEERSIVSAELTSLLVDGVEGSMSSLDSTISSHSRGWTIERMPALDRAILRLGIFELESRPDVPVAVVIDEAVELAKRFSTDDSGKFVNGILAAVARETRPDGVK